MDILQFTCHPLDLPDDIPMLDRHSRGMTDAEFQVVVETSREFGGTVDAIQEGKMCWSLPRFAITVRASDSHLRFPVQALLGQYTQAGSMPLCVTSLVWQ